MSISLNLAQKANLLLFHHRMGTTEAVVKVALVIAGTMAVVGALVLTLQAVGLISIPFLASVGALYLGIGAGVLGGGGMLALAYITSRVVIRMKSVCCPVQTMLIDDSGDGMGENEVGMEGNE